jgi:signal transduction histidine kinase
LDKLTKLWAWFWPPEMAHPELEALQVRMLNRLLWLLLALELPMAWRNWSQGIANVWIPGLMLAVPLLCLALLRRWPAARRWLVVLLVGCNQALVLWTGFAMGNPLCPAAMFLPSLGVFATLLDGPRLGNLFCLLSLAVLLFMQACLPIQGGIDLRLFTNLILGTVFSQGMALAFYGAFSAVQGRLLAQSESLLRIRLQRGGLTQALFSGLQAPLHQLHEALGRLDMKAVEQALRGVSAQLDTAERLKVPLEGGADAGSGRVTEDAQALVRRGLLESMLKLLLLVMGSSLIRNLYAGGQIWQLVGTLVVLAAVLEAHRQGTLRYTAASRLLLVLFVLLFVSVTAFWRQRLPGPGPQLLFLPLLVMAGAFLGGGLEAVLMAAFGLANVAFYLRAPGPAPNALDLHFLGDYAAAVLLMLFFCLGGLGVNAGLARHLAARSNELWHDLKLKRRLLGTLFHDVNNPLMAMQAVLALPQARVPLEAADHERLRRLARRSERLVEAARRFLLAEDGPWPDGALVAVDVAALFGETQELFEARLKAKRQHLTFHSPEGLAVLAQPELLRDSVLSNLVSNALKFAQPGAGLALEARLEGGVVALIVSDTGPGLPDAVRQALEGGVFVPSSAGTAGESGQGLGLLLVKEHLLRMDGRLSFRSSVNGTEAVVCLPPAKENL